jgi:hypothetical protein
MIIFVRLYHVDEVPSGVGGETVDFSKAAAVSYLVLSFCYLATCDHRRGDGSVEISDYPKPLKRVTPTVFTLYTHRKSWILMF